MPALSQRTARAFSRAASSAINTGMDSGSSSLILSGLTAASRSFNIVRPPGRNSCLEAYRRFLPRNLCSLDCFHSACLSVGVYNKSFAWSHAMLGARSLGRESVSSMSFFPATLPVFFIRYPDGVT